MSREHRATVCPVCGLPIETVPACPECGWELQSPLRPGPVTEQLQLEFDERLSRAQREFDTRVAALLGPEFQRYQTHIRGGPPSDKEWRAAQRAARRVTARAVDDDAIAEILTGLLHNLEMGRHAGIAAIDADGITVIQVWLDSFGSPQLHTERGPASWTDLLPLLSRDSDKRSFQLAGGVAQLDRSRLRRNLRESMRRMMPEPPDGPTLVVCRPAGWRLLECAAELACQHWPAARQLWVVNGLRGTTLPALLDALAAQMPLSSEYRLVVATIDPETREVCTGDRLLFAVGDRPGTQASLELRQIPGDSGGVAFAVLVGNGIGSGLLSLSQASPPPEPRYQLQVVLEGPGRVRFTEPPCMPLNPETWPALRDSIPARMDTVLGPVDLVCAIELSGPSSLVRRRRRLVRKLLELLITAYPEPGMLRVGVVGCIDHVYGPRERQPVIRGVALATAEEALEALNSLGTTEIRYPGAAPVEDMLYEAYMQLSGRGREGRAARVLIVAARRPHPHRQEMNQLLPCPGRYNWRTSLHQLTGAAGATCVAVADNLPASWEEMTIWRELGTAALHELPAVTAREVGEDLRLLVPHTQRVPVPLADSE
jgi:hypothetical protein